MFTRFLSINILLLFMTGISTGQVRIRIFAGQKPSSAALTVTAGRYLLDTYDGKPVNLANGDPVIFALYKNKIAVKVRNSSSFMCDSIVIRKLTDDSEFSFRVSGNSQSRQLYNGDLQCRSDLGVMVFINICDPEDYIAGVVRTEGGPGKSTEYLKSQAVLARTYLYRHIRRHAIDGYNLCDDTHCQAFRGISSDTLVNRAVLETKGLVVLDSDSNLIISAFHSNCGGETSTSDFVWLANHSYLKKVNDPYCTKSPNAVWRKSIPLSEWVAYLKKSGFTFPVNGSVEYDFPQITRQHDYRIGSFALPFNKIRNDLSLRSAFFSVVREGNMIILRGRGYGHGVGLCQEGAMGMAEKGLKCADIINFYYSGVKINDIKTAKVIKSDF